MNFNTVSQVTLSNPHKGAPENCHSIRLCEGGMNNLVVSGITSLANLVDQKVRKDLWKLISGVGRRQWSGCNLA